MKKKLLPQDLKLKEELKKGGRDNLKPDFLALIKKASQPSKA